MTGTMTSDVEILLRAAREAALSDDQIRGLIIDNPWKYNSPTAQRLQSAVSRLYPERAKQWLDESGRQMSLLAAAARDGLVPMTGDLQAEIQAFTPQTPDEAKQAEIKAILANGNPWGAQGRYEGDTYIEPVAPNLTAAFQLAALDQQLSDQLKLQANPPQQVGMNSEQVAYVQQEMNRARTESLNLTQGMY